MVLTAVEIIALIFALAGLIKIVTIIINKKIWYKNVAKPIYSNSKFGFVFVVFAVVIFYFLIQEFSIVQIFAVLAFSSLLIAIGFLSYREEFSKLVEKAYKEKLNGWIWLYTLIWVILCVWVLIEIFG